MAQVDAAHAPLSVPAAETSPAQQPGSQENKQPDNGKRKAPEKGRRFKVLGNMVLAMQRFGGEGQAPFAS